jgi:hypothetical protein
VRIFDLLWGRDPRVLMSYAPLRLIGLAASLCPGYRQVRQGTVQPITHQPPFELARKDLSVLTRVRCSCLLNAGLVSQHFPVWLCPGASPPDDPTPVFHRYEATWPCSFSGLRSCSPVRSNAQATRAIVFATATQALFTPARTTSWRIHILVASVFIRARLTTDRAPCMSRHRRYLLPRVDIPAKRVFPPRLYWRGTSPSQAAT